MHQYRFRRESYGAFGLFAFLYSLMLSRLLVGNALYGGALQLAGSAMIALITGEGQKIGWLVSRGRTRLHMALLGLTVAIMLALTTLLPQTADTAKFWLLFAVLMTATVRDAVCGRVLRSKTGLSRAGWIAYALWHLLTLLIGGGLLLAALPAAMAWLAAAGLAIADVMAVYIQLKLVYGQQIRLSEEEARQARSTLSRAPSVLRFEAITSLTATAVQMTMVLLYAYIAVDAGELIFCMLISLVSTFVGREAAEWALRKRRKISDPTNTMIFGLFLWLYGLILFVQQFRRGGLGVDQAYTCLAMVGVGAAICDVCLARLHTRVAAAARFADIRPDAYEAFHAANAALASMLGQEAALLALWLIDWLSDRVPAHIRWQPWLMLPTLVTVAVACLAALRFPLSARYAEKLDRLLHLREAGEQNDALNAQLTEVVMTKFRRPIGVQLAMALIRPFLPQKLIGVDRIVQDPENPIVFLCNHGEIYGPLVSMLYLPVPVRPWVISEITRDPEEMAEYFNHYTLQPIRWIPAGWKLPIARMIGRLCVVVMRDLESIPVYRNKPTMLMRTMRQSVQALEAGDNLLIFPENPNAVAQDHGYETEGVGELFSGFAMLAQIYYKRTGKRCRFQPMFVHKAAHTMSFGRSIIYDPANEDSAERQRISDHAAEQLQQLYRQAERKRKRDGKKKRHG